MATPQPKSFDKILGEILNQYLASTGINDLNTGGAMTSFAEAVAMAVARSSGDLMQVLRDQSVDRAEADQLKSIARDEGLREIPARPSTGAITITDTSFTKISTKVYAGGQPINIGSVLINVSDASQFPATGNLYIGRGTPNIEGPIAYTTVLQTGGFWQITLASPTSKFHNLNEAVVLSQGGTRNIAVGTLAKSPASGASADINFSVTQAAVILDGETEVTGVQVSAQEPGAKGNVPIGGIKTFGSPPFPGAAVTNPLPYKNGRDVETDAELRIRIKRARLSRGLGTELAVKNAVIGISASDENATVASAEIVRSGDQTTLYVDDNTGYEEKTQGVGVEYIVDSALGGETNFQLETGGRQTSVSKAYLQSNLSSPFDVAAEDRIAITVGGVTTEHVFATGDFLSPGAATAYELVASINANANLNFQATTANGGIALVISAKAEDNEDVQVAEVQAGRSVAELVGLPFNRVDTLKLYKNRVGLSKDGIAPTVNTETQANWSPSITAGDTLILAVDATAEITYVFTDADFVNEGNFTTVSPSNSLESWVAVINAKVTGATASVVGERIRLSSNLGANNRAAIAINPASTLVAKNMFSVEEGLAEQGRNSDFVFSRNTGQVKLTTPLSEGDELTAGTEDTEARIDGERVLGGNLTLATAANLWVLCDDLDAEIVRLGITTETLVAVTKPGAQIIRYTSAVPTAFDNLQVGDYVIVWSQQLSAGNRLEGRVYASTSSSFDLHVTLAEETAAVAESGIIYRDGIYAVRTAFVPQRFTVAAGVKTVNVIAAELNAQTDSVNFATIDEEILTVATKTRDISGSIMVVTQDEQAASLQLPVQTMAVGNDSLSAFFESGVVEGEFPQFIHAEWQTDAYANPPQDFIATNTADLNIESLGVDPTVIVGTLQPYQGPQEALQPSEVTITDDVVGAAVTLDDDSLVKRMRIGDRMFVANPLDFGHEDSAVLIFDGDGNNKTFSMPMYRTAKANTTLASNPNTFNAYDSDAGATTAFATFFGNSFDFSNFKALMQARVVVDLGDPEDAILYKSTQWGRSGERVTVGYVYPTAPNAAEINHTVSVGENVDIRVVLKSGAVIPTTIDGTTEWDVTVVPNNPVAGVDQQTFTWSGAGTAPNLGALSGGEYVTISRGSELDDANTGTYRISTEIGFAPTTNSFTVVRAPGGIEEFSRATSSPSVFAFFSPADTTAQEVVDYITDSSLGDLISAAVLDDSGTSGAGVIGLSTAEYSDFQFTGYQLQDGINWISVSNLGGTPQFTFKRPLTVFTGPGYDFNDGTEVRLVPTTIDQTVRLLNILAVTGASTVAEINASRRASRLQIATRFLGGDGSVQMIGGTANSSLAALAGAAIDVNNTYALAPISRAAAQGLHSDQWLRLAAQNRQRKAGLIRETASAFVVPQLPALGSSTFGLTGRAADSRHFGRPRNHTRTQGRRFKVEKQGIMTCVSWDEVGTDPAFSVSANLNDTVSGTMNISATAMPSEFEYTVLTGPLNFNAVAIGDLLEVQNMVSAENNGEFLVVARSADGKTIRVLNANGSAELSSSTFAITSNADVSGDDFEVGGTVFVADTDFPVGLTASETAQNLAAVIGTVAGVTAQAILNTVVVTATTTGSTITTSYTNNSGSAGATVSQPQLTGVSYAPGDFSCQTQVGEGDIVALESPFDVLNQGRFRVVRRFGNSVYFENENSVAESVTLVANPVALNTSGTTEWDVDASLNNMRLNWTGVGTEPTPGNLRPGDELTVGTDFAAANRGVFMISRAQNGKAEITRFTTVGGADITSGQYFLLSSGGDATSYYVWFNVDGAGGDPLVFGATGVPVAITSVASSAAVAAQLAGALDSLLDFEADNDANRVVVTAAATGPATDAVNVDVGGDFEIEILQQGQYAFIEATNPSAVTETGVTVSDVLTAHRPQMLFWEYEAAQPGDTLVITTDALGTDNRDNWIIESVVDDDTVVVAGTMAAVESQSLFGIQDAVFTEEFAPYVGYKRLRYVMPDDASAQRANVCFDTNEQYEKINQAAGVTASAVSKLGFGTVLRKGIDSYRYHTGLIGEANRTVYGDPRDNITYPGVAAAGAEIFIRGPLIRRVQVAISARIETGIPFAQIVEQVRTSVASLIEGNAIGVSIAISDIVSAVNAIPGVRAVAIDSPLYNSSNDTITIQPQEKSRVIDPVTDITVAQIG